MPGIKELKNKIKSIKSTRKITKAMQMVSAAKMRKAQTAAMNSRKYSDMAWELINSLSGFIGDSISSESDESRNLSYQGKTDPSTRPQMHSDSVGMEQVMSLLQVFPNATKTGIIIISTNKGLVGSFNTNLVNKLREIEKGDVIAELVVMGKKVKEAAIRTNRNLIADFTKKDSWVSIDGIYPLAKTVTDLYLSGQYKQVLIIYNHFVSTLTQRPTVKQLLPFEPVGDGHHLQTGNQGGDGAHLASEYLFEPTPELVLNHLIPRIIESQIYQAVLESDASEHSARMVMMKNATEAAGDLIADYTLTYNQLRQNKITTELAEITAGKIALE